MGSNDFQDKNIYGKSAGAAVLCKIVNVKRY